MIQIALLCTRAASEERPTMSEVVQILYTQLAAERWEEWQQVEVTGRKDYETLQRSFNWADDSINNLEAVELSDGR
ncbi:putative LRR receptor-like serine/threonine-protein kinase [Platanthera guangdongensis]|uniref:LRR receptor-like serine/threonine-protein kinase n=1 Tax=Platanthera guangdongensis TaxID=2320717 RepID=A0ABR2MY51_9ASPA